MRATDECASAGLLVPTSPAARSLRKKTPALEGTCLPDIGFAPINSLMQGSKFMDNQTTNKAGNDDELREQLSVLKADLTELSETVQRQAKAGLSQAQDIAGEKLEDLEAQIRRKPITSAAIAAGVGFLIGAILSR
jgi:ElaB/YqjD/DUF883 family membrane-anchored ribosome-binding protein